MAIRTWVSGVGDDANPGSRTAPCKTFAGAVSKTDAGGEINVIDPGGFGAITITKALTIDGGGTFASILASGTTGVTINAGPNDVVTLRNLSIDGGGTGIHGIHFVAGAALHLENCTIFRFSQKGVLFDPASTTSRLYIKDVIIRNNATANGGGVLIQPGAGASVNATLDNVTLEANLFGLTVADRVTAALRNSVVAGNTTVGVQAKSTAVSAFVHIDTCMVALNNASATTTIGVSATGPLGVVGLSNATVTRNGIGLSVANGGQIGSFGNNSLLNNLTSNGAPTSTGAQA